MDPEAETGPIRSLARGLGVSGLVARLLYLRGVDSTVAARRFLGPRLADLSAPAALPDIDAASTRLVEAIRAGERITICGDYDVDGMTGTALLVRFFTLAGADVDWSIPKRDEDGYGLSEATIDALADAGTRVAVTVDNGISAHAALERARDRGIDVIVTDHHLPDGELPPAVALVDPHLAPGGAEAAPPCGCTLAFKLAWAVAERMGHLGRGERAEVFKDFLRDAVGLAALATVCDVVPLLDENRILVTAGLSALAKSRNPGVRALLQVCGLEGTRPSTEDVGFKIGPRLNAAGRLSQPELVIELLTSEDEARCLELAAALDAANIERRRIEAEVVAAAKADAQALLDAGPRSSLVVWGEGWHQGVVGIVAARLVDAHHLPVAVIGVVDGVGRGSCRTPEGIDLHAALSETSAHLAKYGGHAMAAGMELEVDALEAFRDAFEEAVATQRAAGAAGPTLAIDAETPVESWDLDLVRAVERLAPFGRDNPAPRVLLRAAYVAGQPRLMGKASNHLSFSVRQGEGAIRVVAFRRAELYDLVDAGGPLDLVVQPTINEWRGYTTPEFRLVDLRPHDPNGTPSGDAPPPA